MPTVIAEEETVKGTTLFKISNGTVLVKVFVNSSHTCIFRDLGVGVPLPIHQCDQVKGQNWFFTEEREPCKLPLQLSNMAHSRATQALKNAREIKVMTTIVIKERTKPDDGGLKKFIHEELPRVLTRQDMPLGCPKCGTQVQEGPCPNCN